MRPLSYVGYRFPPEIIQHAIWLYLRFTLSFRDVEELLAERGIDVSHETIRRWVAVFGPIIARRLRAMRPKPHRTGHLDDVFVLNDETGQLTRIQVKTSTGMQLQRDDTAYRSSRHTISVVHFHRAVRFEQSSLDGSLSGRAQPIKTRVG